MRRETPLRRSNARRLRQLPALGNSNFLANFGHGFAVLEEAWTDIAGCRTRCRMQDFRRENQSHMPVRGSRHVGNSARGPRRKATGQTGNS